MCEPDATVRIWAEGPLHTAARKNDLAALERALGAAAGPEGERAAAIDAVDLLGFTALHVAACEASLDLVARLLTAGAAVDARAEHDELTPLMLAVARGRVEVVDALLAAGADVNASTYRAGLYPMLSFAIRGATLPVLERLVAAGFTPRPHEASAYFRLALEVLGHGVRFVDRGYFHGEGPDTDQVWVVDRPMTVPASLMAPLLAAGEPSRRAEAPTELQAATWFDPAYAASFRSDPDRYAAEKDRAPPSRIMPLHEVAHEVRCGRLKVTEPYIPDQWSPLGFAVTAEQPALVLALVRSAGFDPAAVAGESDEVAAARQLERGLYPVHRNPLRELLRQALAAGPLRGPRPPVAARPERDAAIQEPARPSAPDTEVFLANVSVGDIADVRRLLQAGASPDARNADGEPALLVAVEGGREEVARLLIEAGADAAAADLAGRTPLDCALERRDRRLEALLREVLRAPADALTRARQAIEDAEGGEEVHVTASAKKAKKQGKVFLDAALRGEDLSAHVPALLQLVRERVRESLSRALVLHFLRRGDLDGIRQLAELEPTAGSDTVYGGFRSLAASAIDFADESGAEIAAAYPLLVAWPSAGSWALSRHLERHPERVEAVLAAIASSPPEALPEMVSILAWSTATRQAPWPAAVSARISSFVAKLLRSENEAERAAAGRALAACAHYPALDLAGIAPELLAALAAGRQPRAVGLALTRLALSREPADESAIERLLAHPQAEVREAAVQVLAWDWLGGRDESAIVARLAAALLDGAPAVRKLAAETLLEGHGKRRPLARLEAPLLARLLAALEGPEIADAAAPFLAAYAMSDPARAQDVLDALAARPATSARLSELAATCRDLVAARDPESCPLCRRLGEHPRWGEDFQEPTQPPPPELAQLRKLATRPEELYQCPHCGTCYRINESGGSFMNNDWTNYTLERMPPPAPGAVWAMTHALVQKGDLQGLDRELLRGADADRQREALDVLAQRVEDGLDVAALEPTLRALLGEPASVAAAAADVLARHWIRVGRWQDVLALSRNEEPHPGLRAVRAAWSAARYGWGDVGPFLARARELLASADEGVRGSARGILDFGRGLAGEEGALTVAAATRLLDSADSGIRSDAAFVLAEAAHKGADLALALPRIAAQLGDDASARWLLDAVKQAAWKGTDVAPLLPALIARLRERKDVDRVVYVLHALQEDGVDISAAFEAVRAVATPGSWAAALLADAGKQA